MLEILLTATLVDPEQSATYAADPIGYFIPLATFTVLFIVWLRIGRDPKLGPPAVRFEPPANLGPAECGFFLDGKINPRDVTAAIINLAVKGYLKIITQNKHGIFAPEDSTLIFTGKKPSDDLTPAEATLFRQFSPEAGYVDITSLVVVLGPGITVFASTLKAELRHKGYLRNNADDVIGWTILTGVLLLGTVLALGFAFSPYSQGFRYYLIGTGLSLPILLWFAFLMPRRTRAGAIVQNQVAGFHKAMAGRDKYMEWFSKGHLDQAKYEEYLPYAIAFGLTKTWSDLGTRVIEHTPDWITLPESVTFDPAQFQTSFLDAVNFIARHEIGSYREPKANSWWESTGGDTGGDAWGGGSGFGGGGFSGGGFGGGGGGSW